MKILLLFPPFLYPQSPYLSLPSLTAFLREEGYEVVQKDVNAEVCDLLLRETELKAACQRIIKEFRKLEQLEFQRKLTQAQKKLHNHLAAYCIYGQHVCRNIEKAKKIVRTKEFYDPQKLQEAINIINLGLNMITISCFLLNNYSIHSKKSSKTIIKAVHHKKCNIFIDIYEKYILPSIHKENPDVIGISFAIDEQIIPGLTLSRLIKDKNPHIHVVLGGNVFTRLSNFLLDQKALFSLFDSVIIYEGEHSFLELVRRISKKEEPKDVPNLIYRKDSSVIRNNEIYVENVNDLPTPTFDGFPLEQYFSPVPVLPILQSRGCYWNQCAFCDHGYGYPLQYRPRNMKKVIEDIKLLSKKHNTNLFNFVDETISPDRIEKLSTAILEADLEIYWTINSRFEKKLLSRQLARNLSRSGCTILYFGLESGCQRILDLMQKGTNLQTIKMVLRNTRKAGIWNHVFVFFGFPTETIAEAKKTKNFILSNKDNIHSVGAASFVLSKHSLVFRFPNRFGVSNIKHNANQDLNLYYDYLPEKGLTKERAEKIYQYFSKKYFNNLNDFDRLPDLVYRFIYLSKQKADKISL